jgi:hypothetical protein
VKYLILIYRNLDSGQYWEGLTDEQRLQAASGYAALNEDLLASGEMIVTESLADPSLAKRVHVREGGTFITDGPFAEVKEQLAGFYLVECESIEHAIERATRVPEATAGFLEVWPVRDLSALGL